MTMMPERIQALEQFSDWEAVFNRDERFGDSWCGDLLGGEQSGFINEIDYLSENHE
jgi:hypothetical protein